MNVILLVQTPEDAAALKDCAAGLSRLTPDALWLVHSPAVLVDLGVANAQVDSQIQAINQAIRDCIGREDYTGAESYKQQRHALTLQKATAATEGYKTMSPEAQEEATKRVFGEFWAARPAPKMSLTMHTQHFEKGEWIEMVNSMKGRWPAEMVHGQFIVAWPGQFARRKLDIQNLPEVPSVDTRELQGKVTIATVQVPAADPKPRAPKKGYLGSPRFKQLCSTGIDALGQIALSYKINPDGLGRLKLAHAIGKHEENAGLLEKAAM